MVNQQQLHNSQYNFFLNIGMYFNQTSKICFNICDSISLIS